MPDIFAVHGDWPDYAVVPQLDHYWEINNDLVDTPKGGHTQRNLVALNNSLFTQDWAGRFLHAYYFGGQWDDVVQAVNDSDYCDLGNTWSIFLEVQLLSSATRYFYTTNWNVGENQGIKIGTDNANQLIITGVPTTYSSGYYFSNGDHQIVITYSGGIVYVYVNGTLVTFGTIAAPTSSTDVLTLHSVQPNEKLHRAGVLKGTALDATQIQNLYDTWVPLGGNTWARHPNNPENKAYSASPSASPSKSPSKSPSVSPSKSPSQSPSASKSPSSSPSQSPSASKSPSASPSTPGPSASPSKSPSRSPSKSPSASPSASVSPSVSPSIAAPVPEEFQTWLEKGISDRVFLVELSAIDLSDGSTVSIYLSTAPFYHSDKQFIPCVSEIPTIDRKGDSTLNAIYLPTYGNLILFIDSDYMPDSERTTPWSLLLYKEGYNFRGCPMSIKMGGGDMDYEDFQTVFTGKIGNLEWLDNSISMTVYDKCKDLEIKIPTYELPENPGIDSNSWGTLVPLVLGTVRNYKPVFLRPDTGRGYLYALSCGVIKSVDTIYFNGAPLDHYPYPVSIVYKDISPALVDANGMAVIGTGGVFSGTATQREWLVQIDSIDDGTQVGEATFRWSNDGGQTFQGSGIKTADYSYNPATFTQVGTGLANVIIGGYYTGLTKRNYSFLVTRTGGVGIVPYPRFKWSDDGGVTWSAEIDISNSDPISLSHGLTVTFTGVGIVTGITKSECGCSPYPHAGIVASGGQAGDVVQVIIEPIDINYRFYPRVLLGDTEVAYRWTNDGGGSWHTGVIPAYFPGQSYIANLFGGYNITFGSSWWSFCGDDSYTFNTYLCTTDLVLGDTYNFSTDLPNWIPLSEGVGIIFYPNQDPVNFPGQDFYLWDQYKFILYSTLGIVLHSPLAETGVMSLDVKGMCNEDGSYSNDIGGIIESVIKSWAGWTDGDFNTAAMSAFKAAFPYEAGTVLDSSTSIQDFISTMTVGIPAMCSIDLEGKFFLKEISEPVGEPVLELTDDDITDFPKGGCIEDNPYERVTLRYDRNWLTQDNLTAIPISRITWAGTEYRQFSRGDSRILQTYPWAMGLGPLDTVIITRTDIKLLAEKVFAIYRRPRETLTIVTVPKVAFLRIGDIVSVRRAKFGLDTGVLFMVVGLDFNLTSGEYTVTLWR